MFTKKVNTWIFLILYVLINMLHSLRDNWSNAHMTKYPHALLYVHFLSMQ